VPQARSIDSIRRFILKPALTHLFSVELTPPNGFISWAANFTDFPFIYNNELTDKISILCNEANLPGSSFLTHEINNDYTGQTERHAYRRTYDDRIDLTFYVDTDYDIIKYFQAWTTYINNDRLSGRYKKKPDVDATASGMPTYNTRVRFPNDYKSEIKIIKFEKNADFSARYPGGGFLGESQLENLEYTFINAFPISINSTPVSYDQPSILKCTVSFTYSRYLLATPANDNGSVVFRDYQNWGDFFDPNTRPAAPDLPFPPELA
jgi:hypothetical protein